MDNQEREVAAKKILLNFGLLKPTEDKIIGEPWFEPSVTESGIMLNSTVKSQYGMLKVIKIGPTVDLKVCDVKVGDFVIIRPTSGLFIQSDKHPMMVIRQAEILGVIDATDPAHDITPVKKFDPSDFKVGE